MESNRKKTICHLTSVHPPFDIRIFHKECISLSYAGYEVFLIAPINYPVQVDGIKLIPIQLSKSRMVRMWEVTYKMFWKALSVRAKVYHFHDPELMFCGVFLRLSGKKVIFDIHENVRLSFQSKDWIPKWAIVFLSYCYWLVEHTCILFYNQLVLAEESYLKYYPQHKSIVVLNYPLTKIQVSRKSEMGSPVKFVYCGVVHHLRGIWEMLELIYRLNLLGYPASLDLVGEIRPTKLEKDIIQFTNKHDLTQKVFIHGKIGFEKVEIFLAEADIGLALLKPIPNYRDSLPTKIFEYMQQGLPVITNDFPLYKKYIEKNKTGICVYIDDMEMILQRVIHLLESPQLLKEMSENGTQVIEKYYNWNSQKAKLIDFYIKLEK